MQKNNQANLGLAIKNTVTAMQKAFDFDLQKNVGINWSQAKVLMMLAEKDGLAQREIADGICIEAPTLVPIIDRMERRGLVERRQDVFDRRNNRVFLTGKSRQIQDSISESMTRIRKVAYNGIAKGELETTMQVMKIINSNVAEYLKSIERLSFAQIQKAPPHQ